MRKYNNSPSVELDFRKNSQVKYISFTINLTLGSVLDTTFFIQHNLSVKNGNNVNQYTFVDIEQFDSIETRNYPVLNTQTTTTVEPTKNDKNKVITQTLTNTSQRTKTDNFSKFRTSVSITDKLLDDIKTSKSILIRFYVDGDAYEFVIEDKEFEKMIEFLEY